MRSYESFCLVAKGSYYYELRFYLITNKYLLARQFLHGLCSNELICLMARETDYYVV